MAGCTCRLVPCTGFARLNPARSCVRPRGPRPAALYLVWLGCGWGEPGVWKSTPTPCRSRNPFSGISIRMVPPPARGSPSGEAGGVDGGVLGLSTPRAFRIVPQRSGLNSRLPQQRGERSGIQGPRMLRPLLSRKTRKEIRCFGKSQVSGGRGHLAVSSGLCRLFALGFVHE